MKKTLWILAGTLIFSSAALADAVCAPGNLSTYLGSSCHIDNLDFSNWTYTPGGTTQIAASSIGVTPITTLLNEGFDFNPAMAVNNTFPPIGGGPFNEDVLIKFTVSTVDGSTTLHDLSIFFNGSTTGTGTTDFTETWNSPPCKVCTFSVQNPPPKLTNDITFASLMSSVNISKDVQVNTQGNGSANVSDFANQFSQVVPEPAYTALLAAGLLGLGWLRKRRQSQV